MKSTAKQLIRQWAEECLKSKKQFDPSQGHFQGILANQWQDLCDRIDGALREAEQSGRDYRKQTKVMADESEFGPFWSEFYKTGGIEFPGLAEAFDCQKDESTWINQWNEVIRIKMKKPVLRAVAPDDLLEAMKCVMSEIKWKALEIVVNDCIRRIAGVTVDESKPSWTPAMLVGGK